MGSIDAACLSGFLCRLCSDMHRTVIHIYGDHGRERGIAQKINAYLPVTISRTDSLPKTICKECMNRVEEHHDLIVRLSINVAKYKRQRRLEKTAADPNAVLSEESSDDEIIVGLIDSLEDDDPPAAVSSGNIEGSTS